jgi:hypothetical protein
MGHNLRYAVTLASAVGNVENTGEKFAVSVDVSHFRLDELKVRTVCIFGKRKLINQVAIIITTNHATVFQKFRHHSFINIFNHLSIWFLFM